MPNFKPLEVLPCGMSFEVGVHRFYCVATKGHEGSHLFRFNLTERERAALDPNEFLATLLFEFIAEFVRADGPKHRNIIVDNTVKRIRNAFDVTQK